MADPKSAMPSSSSAPVLQQPSGPPRRGRRPSGLDEKSRLERSRKSARECRARKKLRYQHLEELIEAKEQAVAMLYSELRQYEQYCAHLDQGGVPPMALLEKLHAQRATLAVQRIDAAQSSAGTTSNSSSNNNDNPTMSYQETPLKSDSGLIGKVDNLNSLFSDSNNAPITPNFISDDL